ncbi:hypothetical protein EI94DRAFT_1702177 [Lactarius quietus]|nr:hypothetical protein EI94DRAFT_1702177 [Lactarius quietus]
MRLFFRPRDRMRDQQMARQKATEEQYFAIKAAADKATIRAQSKVKELELRIEEWRKAGVVPEELAPSASVSPTTTSPQIPPPLRLSHCPQRQPQSAEVCLYPRRANLPSPELLQANPAHPWTRHPRTVEWVARVPASGTASGAGEVAIMSAATREKGEGGSSHRDIPICIARYTVTNFCFIGVATAFVTTSIPPDTMDSDVRCCQQRRPKTHRPNPDDAPQSGDDVVVKEGRLRGTKRDQQGSPGEAATGVRGNEPPSENSLPVLGLVGNDSRSARDVP